MLPRSCIGRFSGIDMMPVNRWLAKRRGVTADLPPHTMRRTAPALGVSRIGQAWLIVKVDTHHVSAGSVAQRLQGNARRTAAGDIRIGPIALAAHIHLMGPTHSVDKHVVNSAPQEVV